tara:strand:+ start:6214 stop:6540 length:327 start_codon:yes stop_codon:yes gene_type:complete
MGIKEFLRPTKAKIISFILLIVISFFLYSFRGGFGVKIPLIVQSLLWVLVLPPIYFLEWTNFQTLLIPINDNGLGNWVIFFVGLSLVLVYQYLIVCIIAGIMNKVVKK